MVCHNPPKFGGYKHGSDSDQARPGNEIIK